MNNFQVETSIERRYLDGIMEWRSSATSEDVFTLLSLLADLYGENSEYWRDGSKGWAKAFKKGIKLDRNKEELLWESIHTLRPHNGQDESLALRSILADFKQVIVNQREVSGIQETTAWMICSLCELD